MNGLHQRLAELAERYEGFLAFKAVSYTQLCCSRIALSTPMDCPTMDVIIVDSTTAIKIRIEVTFWDSSSFNANVSLPDNPCFPFVH